jgi:hypothetical protein
MEKSEECAHLAWSQLERNFIVKRFGFLIALLLLVVLPIFAQVGPKRGELIRADYGFGNQWVDVTQQVRSLIRGESLKFRVDNDTLGLERRSDDAKALRLQFRDQNGSTRQLTFQQNQYVDLRVNSVASLDQQGAPTWGRTNTPDNGACFYRGNFNSDGFCLEAGQSLSAIPNGMNGQISSIKLFGNATVTVFKDSGFSGDRQTFSSSISDLRYGTNSNWADRISSVRVDHPTFTTPGDNNSYRDGPGSDNSYNDRTLQITHAQYGNGNRVADVTDRLNSQIRGGQLNMRVTNDTMGGDPSPNRQKTLTVQYVYNDARGQVVVNEGDMFNLPTDYTPSTSLTIRCESNNNGRNYCPANTHGGVRLSRQISGSSCTQGSTWGYDNNRIWVDNGCRAEFQVLSQFGADVSSTPYGTYITIPNGTEFAIRTNEAIDSATSTEGRRFSAVMYSDVLDSSGAVAIPRGSDVGLIIRSTAGSDLVLDVDSLVVAGQRYVVSTRDLQQQGRDGIGANRRTAEMVGGGAAVGAIIGAVVGGGKGAAIGAAIGAAGGAGAQVLTKGKEVRVPPETILNFKLDTDLHMQSAR